MAVTEARTVDERGREVPVVRGLARAPRWPWKVLPPRLLTHRVKRWMVVEGSAGLSVMGTAVVLAILVVTAHRLLATNIAMVVMAVCTGLWFVLHLGQNWLWSGPGRRHAARAMAADGTCPACGYGIASVPVGDDGLTTCPECASAWRVGAIAACGNCGYDLMGTALDERGEMTCPECSWVWTAAGEQPIPSPR